MEQHDIAIGSLEYDFNKTATFLVSWLDPVKTRQITIVGNKKMLVFDDMQHEAPLTIYDKRVQLATKNLAGELSNLAAPPLELHVGNTYSVPVNKSEPLIEECRDFIDCIFSGQNPQSDGENGLRIVNQLEALVKSYSQNGALINL